MTVFLSGTKVIPVRFNTRENPSWGDVKSPGSSHSPYYCEAKALHVLDTDYLYIYISILFN